MIITVTLNPAVDKTLSVSGFTVDAVNRVDKVILDPGGKGINVAKSVQALGGDTVCLGILGGSTGDYIRTALDRMQIPHNMTRSPYATRTNTKIVDMTLGTNTDINEPGAVVSGAILEDVWCKLTDTAKTGDTVVIAGKNPPGTPDELLAQWTKELRQRGMRVCLDTVGRPMELALLERPYIIKPNREELCALVGSTLTDDYEIVCAAKELASKGIELVAVSMGADGALFVTNKQVLRTFCPKVMAASTVGAGDAMMAALAYYSEKGFSLEEIARRATAVATATVQVSGSQPASLCAVEKLLDLIQVQA